MVLESLSVSWNSIEGEGHDQIGQFDIKGTIENHKIIMKKQYHGQHALYYVGEVD